MNEEILTIRIALGILGKSPDVHMQELVRVAVNALDAIEDRLENDRQDGMDRDFQD